MKYKFSYPKVFRIMIDFYQDMYGNVAALRP